MRMRHLGVVTGAVLATAAALPARAHHSFGAEFDRNAPVHLEGTVVRFEWVNPHSWLVIDVPQADGTVTQWRVEGGAKPRSTARQLSSFRRFYRYLLREGLIADDPTANIAMPKIGRALPQSLTEDEVDALLAAPNVAEPLGHRDRAMLEVLYATGVRVSELINLRMSQINLNQGVLRIIGKGDRERLIPLGDEAQDWLREFIEGPRVEILLERQTAEGTWDNEGWLHTVTPPDSFYTYDLPAKALPLLALARYRAVLG